MFLKRYSANLVAAGMALSALTLAPVAQASGPSGGGGAGGGRAQSLAPVAPVSTSCTPSISMANTTGYFRTWAAIWTNFTVTPCASGGPGTWALTYRNNNTGRIDYRSGGTYTQSSPFSNTIDDDFGPFSTPYSVTLTVTDSHGVQTSQTTDITTRAPKING